MCAVGRGKADAAITTDVHNRVNMRPGRSQEPVAPAVRVVQWVYFTVVLMPPL